MKRATRKKSNLKSAVQFHGHLGPYLVLGLRMGSIAVQRLKPQGAHDLSATVWTMKVPPQSCVLDGIQFSSGCTVGKANIKVKWADKTRARFRRGNHTILIRPTEPVMKMLLTLSRQTSQNKLRKMASTLYELPDDQLFVINT